MAAIDDLRTNNTGSSALLEQLREAIRINPHILQDPGIRKIVEGTGEISDELIAYVNDFVQRISQPIKETATNNTSGVVQENEPREG